MTYKGMLSLLQTTLGVDLLCFSNVGNCVSDFTICTCSDHQYFILDFQELLEVDDCLLL